MTYSVQGFLDATPDMIPEMDSAAQPRTLSLPEVIYQTVMQGLEINNAWRHKKSALNSPQKWSKTEKTKLYNGAREDISAFYETFNGVKNDSLRGLAFYHFFNVLEQFGDDTVDGDGEDIKLWKRMDPSVTEDALSVEVELLS